MGNFKIKKEKGNVIIEDDEITKSLTFTDDEHLKEKIKSNPHLEHWDKEDILKELGLYPKKLRPND